MTTFGRASGQLPDAGCWAKTDGRQIHVINSTVKATRQ
jgi:hypothetical protein